MAKSKNANALKILHERYVHNDVAIQESVEHERLTAQIARMIYDLRKRAGISQTDLAALVGTTQSVISRLEDSDYDGHSLSMLERIATALNGRVSVIIDSSQPGQRKLRNKKADSTDLRRCTTHGAANGSKSSDTKTVSLDKRKTKVSKRLSAKDIRALRESHHLNPAAFARYLNISESTLQKWESGRQVPTGPALKLLNVILNHGFEVLA